MGKNRASQRKLCATRSRFIENRPKHQLSTKLHIGAAARTYPLIRAENSGLAFESQSVTEKLRFCAVFDDLAYSCTKATLGSGECAKAIELLKEALPLQAARTSAAARGRASHLALRCVAPQLKGVRGNLKKLQGSPRYTADL